LNLSQSEQDKLDELLIQIKALGIEQNSPLLGETTLDDLDHQDILPILLDKITEVIPPFLVCSCWQ
jgi:Tfp pilus assembly protein PilN